MPAENTVGLLIRAVDFSNTSKVVTFLTRDFGKIGALAKGARRLKSSFEAALDLLAVCRIGVIRKSSGGLDLLTEAVLVERFGGLHAELVRLHAAYVVAEVLDGLLPVGDPHPLAFDAAVVTLRRLAAGDPPRSVLSRFGWRLLRELGFAPTIDHCVACGGAASLSDRAPFSVSLGGLLCHDCAARSADRRLVRGGALRAVHDYINASDEEFARLAASASTDLECWSLLTENWRHVMGRPLRSLGLLPIN